MKTVLQYIAIYCTFIFWITSSLSHAQDPSYAPDAIIIKFREGVVFQVPMKQQNPLQFKIPEVDKLNRDHSCTEIRQIMKARHTHEPSRAFLLHLSGAPDIPVLVEEYLGTGFFQYAEPDYVATIVGDLFTPPFPNDLYFYHQWNLYNDGTFPYAPAKAGADIDMMEAWQIEQGDSTIVATILDSGCKTDHPELSSRLRTSPDELPDNGIDDDLNGYVDDRFGWNFAYSSNDVTDDMWHGTAVAGVIGAEANNGFGYAGVDWHCRLQVVKVLDASGSGVTSNLIDGIYYAVDNGGNVLNMSLVLPNSQALQEAINYAYDNNVTVAAATGNNNSGVAQYPAAYPTVIAAGATSSNDERARKFWCGNGGSNYGNHLAVVAPGDLIPVLWFNNNYEFGYYYGCGTSWSAPQVVGTCTLLLAQDSTRSPDDMKSIIMSTAEDLVGDPQEDTPGWDKYYGSGRLNVYQALSLKKNMMNTKDPEAGPLYIYPNPASNSITLELPNINWPTRNTTLTIYNLNGQALISRQVSGQEMVVDVSVLSQGVYFVKISDKQTVQVGKFVKQ